MAICLGPVDVVTSIEVGDKEIFSGYHEGGRLSINKPDLFGGDEREGGITGDLDVMLGEPSQGVSSYLSSKIDGAVSAFRGVLPTTPGVRRSGQGRVWRCSITRSALQLVQDGTDPRCSARAPRGRGVRES